VIVALHFCNFRFVGNTEVTPSLGGASMHNEVPEKRGLR